MKAHFLTCAAIVAACAACADSTPKPAADPTYEPVQTTGSTPTTSSTTTTPSTSPTMTTPSTSPTTQSTSPTTTTMPATPTNGNDATNTSTNQNSSAPTVMDQGNSAGDLKITQQIRKAVVGDSSLSFTAKNVKIITRDSRVVLRGTVNTDAERANIEAKAKAATGVSIVDDQIEVKK